jgi:phosphoglucomutase
VAEGGKLVTVEDIVKEHWAKYGRNYFSRYDYEECDAEPAAAMMKHVGALIASASDETIRDRVQTPHYKLAMCDDFEYTDPFDSSVAAHQVHPCSRVCRAVQCVCHRVVRVVCRVLCAPSHT